MRSSTFNLVNSFSQKTRGEEREHSTVSAPPFPYQNTGSLCVKVRRVEQVGKVKNWLEVHGSNSTSDRAVHVGSSMDMTSKAADGMRSRTKPPCFEAKMSRMASVLSAGGDKPKSARLASSPLFEGGGLDRYINNHSTHGLLQDSQRPHFRGVPHGSPSASRSCWSGRYGLFSTRTLPMRLARDIP
jgi:hypothetical protein